MLENSVKGRVYPGHVDKIFRAMNPANTRIVAYIRSNELDHLVCQVHDCFVGSKVGTMVDETGRAQKCHGFSQRAGRREIKVKLNVRTLLSNLGHSRVNSTGHYGTTQWWTGPQINVAARGFKYTTVIYEELCAFEYAQRGDVEVWDRSVNAWLAVLQSLGAPSRREMVLKVLTTLYDTDGGGQARKQHSHASVLYNHQEVKELLRKSNNAEFMKFWRVDD